jgi:hypothetical protein
MNPSIFICAICGKLVPWEMSATNEHGQPVHEHCYTSRSNSELPDFLKFLKPSE